MTTTTAESEAAATARPKAYSYIRFSTPAQSQGDSFRRQTEKAARYAADHGLDLDTELNLTDLGVSDYRLKNARKGALGAFLGAVEEGRVLKGSFLLVENMDRLTRAEIMGALGLFSDVINAGITLVTLTNGEAYSKDQINREPHQLYIIIAELMRSHHESSRKGQLVSDAKEAKRRRLQNGEPLKRPYTKQTPAWIEWHAETTSYRLIPKRAALIREIFEMADGGWGMDRIARALNARSEPTWETQRRRRSAHWRGAYLRRIATTKAPLGFFTPTKTTHDEETNARRDIPLEPVKLWPAAVDEELYWRVHRRFQTTAPRGKNAIAPIKSLVQGIAKCTCGASVVRVSKGPTRGKHYVYLLCSKAHSKAGCEHLPVRIEEVEKSLRTNVSAIVSHAPRGKETEELDREIADLQAHVDDQEGDLYSLVQFAADTRTAAAREAVREKERQLEGHRRRLRNLRSERDTKTATSVRERLHALEAKLSQEPLDTAAANNALRQTFRKIIIQPREGLLELHWHHSDEVEEVPFYSRHKRWD